jgi:HlyD family secretion protein
MTTTSTTRVALAALLAAGGLALSTLQGCGTKHNGGDHYRTAAIDRGDVTMVVTATGTLSAVTTVQVGSQVSGIIQALHADFNTPVQRGQLLAELDPTPFQAQVEQRRADLVQAEVQQRNAEISLRRQERLREAGLTTEADYDSAKANSDASVAMTQQARAALLQAETNLHYTKIMSPIDGVVVSRQYDVGQTVAASFQAPTLFTIAQDLTKMQVQADVDQADIGQVAVGQPVRFTVDAYPEQDFQGRITQVRLNATVNQNVITYPVIIEVANPELKLRPQMTADISIEVAVVHDVLRVPNAALRFKPEEGAEASESDTHLRQPDQRPAGRAGGSHPAGGHEAPLLTRQVHVLKAGTLRPVAVQLGISDGRFTEVTGGPLTEGDLVVTGLATARVSGSSGRAFGMRGP